MQSDILDGRYAIKLFFKLWKNATETYRMLKYTLTLRNKFDALQEISETPILNDEYENFVNAHLKALVECKPTKQWAQPSL